LFRDGYYELNQQPTSGLATARMVAMLTYRSGESFEKRFGRKPSSQSKYLIPPAVAPALAPACNGSSSHPSVNPSPPPSNTPMRQFSAQDYLDYQGAKFLRRFDANCYLHLTHKMDTHDVRRGRVFEDGHPHLHGEGSPLDNITAAVLSRVPLHALVVGIESDVLFLPTQQHGLAASLPDATLAMLKSPDGHDAFLLEFDKLNHLIIDRLKWQFPTMYEGFVERTADVDMSNLTNGISVGEVD
jgi:homoserine O-acetyltransferase